MEPGIKVRIDMKKVREYEKLMIDKKVDEEFVSVFDEDLSKYAEGNGGILTGIIVEKRFGDEECNCDKCKELKELGLKPETVIVKFDQIGTAELPKFRCSERDIDYLTDLKKRVENDTADIMEMMMVVSGMKGYIRHEQCQFTPIDLIEEIKED